MIVSLDALHLKSAGLCINQTGHFYKGFASEVVLRKVHSIVPLLCDTIQTFV